MKIKEQIITKSDVTQSKAKRRLETYSFDDLPVMHLSVSSPGGGGGRA